jgi:hypothetical protein
LAEFDQQQTQRLAEKVPIAMTGRSEDIDDSKPLVRRGRVESVDLYEIKDSELDLLERGTPAALQLNFAIFLLSIAFSSIVSLLTTTFTNKAIQTCFIVVSVIGVLLGLYLMIAWYGTKKEVGDLCDKIRGRIPPDVLTVDGEPQNSPDLSAADPEAVPSPKD